MSYTIKILSSEEFESLPYGRVSEALGVADPKTNTAYVRQTAYPELNKYLIDHEFEHLIEEHPTDEIDGVRYKIPLIGPLLGGLGKALPAIGGFASKALPSIGGMFSGGSGGGGFLSNLIGGAGNMVKNVGGGLLNMFNPFGGSQSLAGGISVPSGQSNFLSKSQLAFQNGMQPQGFSGIMNSFKNPSSLLGAGMLGAGLLKGLPKVPPMPDTFNQIKSQAQSGGSPLGQQAQGVVSSNLMKQFNPLTAEEITAATANLDQSRMQDIKRLEDLYASARPGTDYTTDSTYKRDLNEIESNYAQNKANLIADRTRSAEQMFNQNQYANIQAAMGASDQQMQQLMQIAQMEINQIMAQLNMDYQQAASFKEMFMGIGQDLLYSGLGLV